MSQPVREEKETVFYMLQKNMGEWWRVEGTEQKESDARDRLRWARNQHPDNEWRLAKSTTITICTVEVLE